MSFWSNLLSGFGSVAKDVFVVGTLNGLVLEAKASVDKNDKLSVAEKAAMHNGIDLLAERVRAKINKPAA